MVLKMQGYIHSTESCGTVDGPGIRFVVFFQGCPMRCRYCHNPDTWQPHVGKTMTVDEIIAEMESKKEFYTHGGITCTGGEPLLQIDFLTELFTRCKELGIHTCLDTSGITYNEKPETIARMDKLMAVTDLIMLDIKHIDPQTHQWLVAQPNDMILKFAQYTAKKKVPLWIRHVLVPGITDKEEDLLNLGRFIGRLSNLQALDVLPYHTMGVVKYKNLGLEYPLKDVPAATKDEAIKAREIILEGAKQGRHALVEELKAKQKQAE